MINAISKAENLPFKTINDMNYLNLTSSSASKLFANTTSTPYFSVTTYVVTLSVILSLIFILGVIFNLISIFTIVIAKAFQPINILILNLATADLVYIAGVPLFLAHIFSQNWPFGLIGCQIFFLTDFIGMIVGVYTIVALSVERYFDIADEKKRLDRFSERSKKRFICGCIVMIWIFAAIFSFPMIVNIKIETRNISVSCGSDWNERQINTYFMIKFLFMFLMPCLLIMFSSIKILQFLSRWRRSSLNRKLTLDHLISLKYKNSKRRMRKASSLNAIKIEPTSGYISTAKMSNAAKTTYSAKKAIIKMTIRKQSALVAPIKRKKSIRERSNSSRTENSVTLFPIEPYTNMRGARSMPVIKDEFESAKKLVINILPKNRQVLIYTPLKLEDSISSTRLIPVKMNEISNENGLAREKKENLFKRSLKKIIPSSYRSKMRRKASRIVLMIVLMFLIQWIPLWLFQLYNTFSESKIRYIQLINVIINLMSYSNSIANPALYMFLTYNFKKNCKIIFHRRPFKRIGYLSSTFFFATENKLKLNQFI